MGEAASRLDRITVDPWVCHGAPTIRGMRLRVQDVLGWLASGTTYDEILIDYDERQRDDILAVLEFAALDWQPGPRHSRPTGRLTSAFAGT